MGCCLSNTLSVQHLQTWTQGLETNFFGVLSAILAFLFTSVYLDCFSTTNQNRSSNGSFESRSFRQANMRSKERRLEVRDSCIRYLHMTHNPLRFFWGGGG